MGIPLIIAIDGPAASGKSTLGQKLAERLGYLYFDTGVMYRAVAWAAIHRGASLENEEQITRLAKEVEIDVRQPSERNGRTMDVLVDGQDVSWEIRHPEVDAGAAVVAAYPGVREAMTGKQRAIGLRGRVVMVGRDIGTVVLPEAGLKIYLDASAEVRAKRRFLELSERGEPVTYEAILEAMRERDRRDTNRLVAPLKPAEDAVRLNSDDKDADQVLESVLSQIPKNHVSVDNTVSGTA